MDIVTCNGSQFRNIKVRDSDIGDDYIGFKYLRTSDFLEDNMFSFVCDKNKLLGVLKYSIEERKCGGLKGLLGIKFSYIRLYFIDIRSDKKGEDRSYLCDLMIDEFCEVIDSLNQSKKIINISTFKGYDFDNTVENMISNNIGKVKFIRRGRKKYGK